MDSSLKRSHRAQVSEDTSLNLISEITDAQVYSLSEDPESQLTTTLVTQISQSSTDT